MRVFPLVKFYINVANLLASDISLPGHMNVASATNAFPYVINARSDEPSPLHELELDNTTHENKEWVGTNIVSPSLQTETPISR